MTSRVFLLAVSMISIGPVSVRAQVMMARDRPFTAIRTISLNRPGERQYTVSAKMARSSESSTYLELPDARNGEIVIVTIMNCPKQRIIMLYPKERQYTIQNMSCTIPPPRPPVAEEIERDKVHLKSLQPRRDQRDDGAIADYVPLGFRTQDGFLEFGDRRTYSNLPSTSGLKEKVWETWSILGESLNAESASFDESHQMRSDIKLTSIQATEPDPHLFEIPTGYTLRPPPPQR